MRQHQKDESRHPAEKSGHTDQDQTKSGREKTGSPSNERQNIAGGRATEKIPGREKQKRNGSDDLRGIL